MRKVSGEFLVNRDFFDFENFGNWSEVLATPPRLERGTYCLEGRGRTFLSINASYRIDRQTRSGCGFHDNSRGLTKSSGIQQFRKVTGEQLVNFAGNSIHGPSPPTSPILYSIFSQGKKLRRFNERQNQSTN